MSNDVVKARLFKGPRDGDFAHVHTDYITERKPLRVSVIHGRPTGDPMEPSISWELYEAREIVCWDLEKSDPETDDPDGVAVALVWSKADDKIPIERVFPDGCSSAAEGVFKCPVSFGGEVVQ